MEDASITIVVREINSLRVFITGEVNKPGPYPITSATTVMQLISLAGGLREYANSKNIMIMRKEGDKQTSLKFNYKEVAAGKNLKQNIDLKPATRWSCRDHSSLPRGGAADAALPRWHRVIPGRTESCSAVLRRTSAGQEHTTVEVRSSIGANYDDALLAPEGSPADTPLQRGVSGCGARQF